MAAPLEPRLLEKTKSHASDGPQKARARLKAQLRDIEASSVSVSVPDSPWLRAQVWRADETLKNIEGKETVLGMLIDLTRPDGPLRRIVAKIVEAAAKKMCPEELKMRAEREKEKAKCKKELVVKLDKLEKKIDDAPSRNAQVVAKRESRRKVQEKLEAEAPRKYAEALANRDHAEMLKMARILDREAVRKVGLYDGKHQDVCGWNSSTKMIEKAGVCEKESLKKAWLEAGNAWRAAIEVRKTEIAMVEALNNPDSTDAAKKQHKRAVGNTRATVNSINAKFWTCWSETKSAGAAIEEAEKSSRGIGSSDVVAATEKVEQERQEIVRLSSRSLFYRAPQTEGPSLGI